MSLAQLLLPDIEIPLTCNYWIIQKKKKNFDTIILTQIDTIIQTHVHIYVQIYNYTHFYIKIDQNPSKYLWWGLCQPFRKHVILPMT